VLDEYEYRFELGKAKLVRDGTDALVVSSGFMTMRALEAAKLLEKDRVSLAVLHTPTIKPLDEEAIVREARKGGRMVVVAENHSVIGGLGEAVAGTPLRAGVAPAWRRRRSARWRCRTRSWTPARCRRCTTGTASRPRRWRGASRAGCDRAADRRGGVGMTTVGFVGLGSMGLPMARNMVARKLAVRGFDMRPEAGEALAAAGCERAASARTPRRARTSPC
jgi:Transketolase, C-terminal domain/NAD binding domain of 6-phosphogluconate dehydrogenase